MVVASTHTRFTANNPAQVANSASYPQRDGKCAVCVKSTAADWGDGIPVCCTANPLVC